MKRVGILGGTFNPIHLGHLILAQNAADFCKLDKVLIMPSGVSYFKDPSIIVDTNHRINMVTEAIKDNKIFELSTIETNRRGNSYTYETLTELVNKNPDEEYYYIIGADTLFSISTWKCPDQIFDKCTVVCTNRDNKSNDELLHQKEILEKEFSAKIIIMNYPDICISSSFIRKQLEIGNSCKYYMPESVLRYINENGLYGTK